MATATEKTTDLDGKVHQVIEPQIPARFYVTGSARVMVQSSWYCVPDRYAGHEIHVWKLVAGGYVGELVDTDAVPCRRPGEEHVFLLRCVGN